MTKEEKELIYKDICGRLPYNYLTLHFDGGDITLDNDHQGIGRLYGYQCSQEFRESHSLEMDDFVIVCSGAYYGDVKPYLRPMSSMTEEEKKEFAKASEKDVTIAVDEVNRYYQSELDTYAPLLSCYNKIDWLNANGFDYRGLIGMGLAINSSQKNN